MELNKMERVVKKYFDGLDEGKLLGKKCTRCGKIEFPPLIMCSECGCQDVEWVEISGKGVMTDIVLTGPVNMDPDNDDLIPYGYGVIELENSVRRINAIVCGLTKKNKPELMKKLPVPVQARIIQRKNFKSVIFDLVED